MVKGKKKVFKDESEKRFYETTILGQEKKSEKLLLGWLERLYRVNDALMDEFDCIYMESFIVLIHELKTAGIDFLEDIGGKETHDKPQEWYGNLRDFLIEISDTLSEIEWDYIEFMRVGICHIFNNSYDDIKENGQYHVLRGKKEKKIPHFLRSEFIQIEMKYGGGNNFPMYIYSVLSPKISELKSRFPIQG